MRPLAALLCCGSGSFVLDGTQRMRERPIVDLVDGLRQLGADITCSDTGYIPMNMSPYKYIDIYIYIYLFIYF